MARALYITAINKLALREFSPTVTDPLRQCLVKMLAAAVHPADRLAIAGKYPRASTIAGNEGVGKVLYAPKNAQLKKGDHVIVIRSDVGGVWAEEQIFDVDCLFPVPRDLAVGLAATLRINPGSAFQLLQKYAIYENILLSAANSQVAKYILQLVDALQYENVKIVGLVRSEERLREMESLSPNRHRFFLQDSDDWASLCKTWTKGVGIDCIGGELSGRMLRALPEGSTLCAFGSMSGEPLKTAVAELIFNGKKIEGFWVSRWYKTEEPLVVRSMLQRLTEMAMSGKIKAAELDEIGFGDADDVSKLKGNSLIVF